MKRYKKRVEQRLVRKSKKVIDELKWDEAVNVLTVALGRAIWQEGGDLDDALATAEIVYFALCDGLISLLGEGHGERNVIPFKRKKKYLHSKRGL
jgi:hypothetical protein